MKPKCLPTAFEIEALRDAEGLSLIEAKRLAFKQKAQDVLSDQDSDLEDVKLVLYHLMEYFA